MKSFMKQNSIAFMILRCQAGSLLRTVKQIRQTRKEKQAEADEMCETKWAGTAAERVRLSFRERKGQ